AVRDEISLTPGARELVEACAERDWPVGLVSGGFHEIIDPLVAELPIARVQANRLEGVGGELTGRVSGAAVDRAAQAAFLRSAADEAGVPLSVCCRNGDGAS